HPSHTREKLTKGYRLFSIPEIHTTFWLCRPRKSRKVVTYLPEDGPEAHRLQPAKLEDNAHRLRREIYLYSHPLSTKTHYSRSISLPTARSLHLDRSCENPCTAHTRDFFVGVASIVAPYSPV
ncbi:unnamed protein product, partial [Ectocarpus sp. 8 AP-2014]